MTSTRATLARMTTPSSASEVPQFDFDALYRGESPAEGIAPMTTPPWDTKAPKEMSWAGKPPA
jgi:hypothetical protein